MKKSGAMFLEASEENSGTITLQYNVEASKCLYEIFLLIKFASPTLKLGVKKTIKKEKDKMNPVASPLQSKILSLNLIFRVQYRFIDG